MALNRTLSAPNDNPIEVLQKKTDEALQKFKEFWSTPLDDIINVYLDEKSPDSRKGYAQFLHRIGYAQFLHRIDYKSEADTKILAEYRSSLEDKLECKEYVTPRQLALLSNIYLQYSDVQSGLWEKAIEIANKAVKAAELEKKDALGARDVLGICSRNVTRPYNANDWIESANEGSLYALNRLAEVYWIAEGSPDAAIIPDEEDPSKEALREKSQALKHQTVQQGGAILMRCEYIKTTLRENKDLLMQTVAEGGDTGLFILADHHYQSKNLATAEQLSRWILRNNFYESNEARSMLVRIADIFWLGEYGVKKDEKKALHLTRAADQMDYDFRKAYQNRGSYKEPLKSYIIYHIAMLFENMESLIRRSIINNMANLPLPDPEILKKEFKELALNNPTLFDELLREDSLAEVEAKLPDLLGDALAETVLRRSEVYVRARDSLVQEPTSLHREVRDAIYTYEMNESHLASKRTSDAHQRKMVAIGVNDPRLLRQPTALSEACTETKYETCRYRQFSVRPSAQSEDAGDKKQDTHSHAPR